MTFVIHGETPSKKNSRILNTKTKKSFPNQKYNEWHGSAVAGILSALRKGEAERVPAGSRVEVTLMFYHGDLKRRDSDNQCSSVLDTLTDSGVLEDDNWKVIPVKHIFDFYDKRNARCEVTIEELDSDSRTGKKHI